MLDNFIQIGFFWLLLLHMEPKHKCYLVFLLDVVILIYDVIARKWFLVTLYTSCYYWLNKKKWSEFKPVRKTLALQFIPTYLELVLVMAIQFMDAKQVLRVTKADEVGR